MGNLIDTEGSQISTADLIQQVCLSMLYKYSDLRSGYIAVDSIAYAYYNISASTPIFAH